MASVTQPEIYKSSSLPSFLSSSIWTYHKTLLMLSTKYLCIHQLLAVSNTNVVQYCFNRFYYYFGMGRPTGREITAITKVVYSTDSSQVREYISHHRGHTRNHWGPLRGRGKGRNCGQEPLLWFSLGEIGETM